MGPPAVETSAPPLPPALVPAEEPTEATIPPTPTATPEPVRPTATPPPAPTATPTPVPPVAVSAQSVRPSCSFPAEVERWREAVSRYPWQPCEALTVLWCESKGDPGALNPSGASGLLQIMMPLHRGQLAEGESVFTPEVNLRVGAALWRERGWAPWIVGGCYP